MLARLSALRLARTATRRLRAARTYTSQAAPASGAAALNVARTLKTSPTAASSAAVPPVNPGSFTELQRHFLDPEDFYKSLNNHGIDFFTGVPDSLLKDFCSYMTANVSPKNHIITANEGNAVAAAGGYHMATGRYAMVYLQNSGLGNIVNPIMSMAVPDVYSLPMLLLIGWRGEPGKKDEPQHLVQGMVTPGLLASLEIPFQVLPDYKEGMEKVVRAAATHLKNSNGPYALLVKRQTFAQYKLPATPPKFSLNREGALKVMMPQLSDWDIVVSTTGMLSRELFEYRVAQQHSHERDFLTVGSMGHAVSIALGIAVAKPSRQVFCLDGDGSVIMHMGSLATVGHMAPPNLKHVVINNGAHDSVGGQPTPAQGSLSLCDVAKGCGYQFVESVSTPEQIVAGMERLKAAPGPGMLEVHVNMGGRKDLGRPTRTPLENKEDFMRFLQV